MKLPKFRWILLILVVVGIAGYVTYTTIHTEPTKIQVDKVLVKDLVQKVAAPGKVQPVEEVSISAYVSAEITKLFIAEGDDVTKGQKLVELDSTRYRASLDQARAGLYSAKAQRKLANARVLQSERLLERTKELFKKDLVGKQELEDIETQQQVNMASYEAAQDGVSQAEAILRLARDDVSKTTLSAPIEGKISSLDKEVGEIVMGSQLTRDIIMTVADLSEMEVVVEVDENDVVDINLEDLAEVEVDAFPKKEFNGKVSDISISPKVKGYGTQEETTTFEVTVLLEDDVSKLRPGMNATANIIIEDRTQVMTLPIQCVTMRDPELEEKKAAGEDISTFRSKSKDALKEVVFKYDENKVTMVTITTGISSDTEIEITEGVAADEKIVCGPYKTLHKELSSDMDVEIAEPESEEKD